MEGDQAARDDLEGSEQIADVFDQEEDGLDLHDDREQLYLTLKVLSDLLLAWKRLILVIGAVVVAGVRTAFFFAGGLETVDGGLLSDRVELCAFAPFREILPLVFFGLRLLEAILFVREHLLTIRINVHLFGAGAIHGRVVSLTHHVFMMHDGSIIVVPTIVRIHYYN